MVLAVLLYWHVLFRWTWYQYDFKSSHVPHSLMIEIRQPWTCSVSRSTTTSSVLFSLILDLSLSRFRFIFHRFPLFSSLTVLFSLLHSHTLSSPHPHNWSSCLFFLSPSLYSHFSHLTRSSLSLFLPISFSLSPHFIFSSHFFLSLSIILLSF